MQLQDMNSSDLFDANVRNLTELWTAMGARALEPATRPALHASELWPDRLWYEVDVRTTPSDARRLVAATLDAGREWVVPVWRRNVPERAAPGRGEDDDLVRELEGAGLEVGFEQTVMSLDLAGWSPESRGAADVTLGVVGGSRADRASWADVASRSFGYTVPVAVVERLLAHPAARLLIASEGGHAVGTGLVFGERGLAGLHMVGVLPEARRMGIARKIMRRLLDDAREHGFTLATLQASDMGEGLYRQLGFGAEGRISNFRRPRDASEPPARGVLGSPAGPLLQPRES